MKFAYKNKVILLLILLVFLAPILAAWFFYQKPSYINVGTSNRGNFIQPPTVLISPEYFDKDIIQMTAGKWGLVFVNPGYCNVACIMAVYKIYLIDRAVSAQDPDFYGMLISNKKDSLVNPMYTFIRHLYNTIIYNSFTETLFTKFLNQLPPGTQKNYYGLFYLVNPQGFVIMSYPDSESANSMLKDYKHLKRN